MGKDDRLVELMADLLHELRGLRNDMAGSQERTDERLDKIVDQQSKTNLAIGELRQSVMKLSDQFEKFTNFEERIRKLEQTVFRQAS